MGQGLKQLSPWLDGEKERSRDRARFDHFIPKWLAPQFDKGETICSVGCGSGLDVEMLRSMGFDAWGFDPTRSRLFEQRAAAVRPHLATAVAADRPFSGKKFDRIYSLEVIEHVGCKEAGTRVEPDFIRQRDEFIRDSLSLLKPGGSFILTSTNRLCLIDPGHAHRYFALGDWFYRLTGLGLSIPMHPRNFLWSIGDIRRSIARLGLTDRYEVRPLSIANYPRASARRSLMGAALRAYLRAVSLPGLRAGPLALILAVEIRERTKARPA